MIRLVLSLATLVLLSTGRQVHADVITFQDIAQDHPALAHQYTFDGLEPFERLQDNWGTAHLLEQAAGSATVSNIIYGAPGFDESSQAATTYRPPPGGVEFSDGANFRIPSVTLGDEFSFEVVFRPSQATISGGAFNLGYILANRVGCDRGYFLFQGSAELDQFGAFGTDGNDLASVIGSSFNVNSENTLLENLQAGNWYYAAGSYLWENGTTTFINCVADLTENQEKLTIVGPITVPGSYGRTAVGMSIGGRFDGPGEGFPGDIDEVNIYSEWLDEGEFEDHLLVLLEGAGGGTPFHRGDPNDSGGLDLSDGLFIFNFLFSGGSPPGCNDAADSNGDGGIDLSDGIFLLSYLFLGGPPPAAPGPPDLPCGPSPADSLLGCEMYSGC